MKLKKSTLLTKLIILILAVYATITLLSLQTRIQQVQADTAALQTQVDAVTQENSRLEAEIERAGTQEAVEEFARSRLGYVYEGEIIFQDIGD